MSQVGRSEQKKIEKAIASRIRLDSKFDSEPNLAPRLILIRSICRGGSTALCRVFARSGYPVLFQPMKSIYRNMDRLPDLRLNVPSDVGADTLVIKETNGAHDKNEATLDYLGILKAVGYPWEKIYTFDVLRDPYNTLNSWKLFWEVDINIFVKSYKSVYKYMRQNRDVAGKLFYYPGIIYDLTATVTTQRMFEKLDLEINKAARDWTVEPVHSGENLDFGEYFHTGDEFNIEKNYYFINERWEGCPSNIHDKVNNAAAFSSRYMNPPVRHNGEVKEADHAKIKEANLEEMFEELKSGADKIWGN